MVLSIGSKEDKKKEMMIASILKGATMLAEMDDTDTVSTLRALANLVQSRVNKDFNLCTHGCDVTPDCPNLHKEFCKLKTIYCEGAMPDEGSSDRELFSEGSEEDKGVLH